MQEDKSCEEKNHKKPMGAEEIPIPEPVLEFLFRLIIENRRREREGGE